MNNWTVTNLLHTYLCMCNVPLREKFPQSLIWTLHSTISKFIFWKVNKSSNFKPERSAAFGPKAPNGLRTASSVRVAHVSQLHSSLSNEKFNTASDEKPTFIGKKKLCLKGMLLELSTQSKVGSMARVILRWISRLWQFIITIASRQGISTPRVYFWHGINLIQIISLSEAA